MKTTSITVKACTAASYKCVCGRGGVSQATCKNPNKIASYEGFLIYLTELTFTLAPVFDAWIQFPGTKEIHLYDKATASLIIIIDSGQPPDDDARVLSTGVCQYTKERQGRGGGLCRGGRKAAQSSFIHTDTHPLRSGAP